MLAFPVRNSREQDNQKMTMTKNSQETQDVSQLKRALLAMKQMQAKVEALEKAKHEPIAIIGMGCRFPKAANPAAFWQLLHDGVDAISAIPNDRWDVAAYYDPDPATPNKMYVRVAGVVDEIDTFDADFFGIKPLEACEMDPQQRLLLEVGWEALEHAGLAPKQLEGTPTGVYIGAMDSDYRATLADDGAASPYIGTGTDVSFLAGRMSYLLGLQGPTLVVTTACSASLVAVHLACQALRARECDLALAGGVNLLVSPRVGVLLSKLQALAPDGRCKTFDARADGYGRGEGCGIVVLKRLSDALQDGDTILALIRGSAINHNGASGGLTVPNGRSQETLLLKALDEAKVAADAVSYVETHGTGTALGDPIELRALARAMGKARTTPLLIGSVKTNIGHLELAAGVAGLLKVILALQHQAIPPHLHFSTPNPHIPWPDLPVKVTTELTPWPQEERIAGVSSFGMSGTNAHLIVAAAPEPVQQNSGEETSAPVHHILTLSAKTEKALAELQARYITHIEGAPTLQPADMCFTANTGRSHFAYRLAITAQSLAEMQSKLRTASGKRALESPQIAFLFTGQGSQYRKMGRDLYATQPLFRQTVDRCAEILQPLLERPLLSVLFADESRVDEETTRGAMPPEEPASGTKKQALPTRLDETVYAQPALFTIGYALAMLWKAWGVEPTLVLGHSIGELVAACVAGVFSLEDGLKLVAARGRLMQALPQNGRMVVVMADEATVAAALAPYSETAALAAINSHRNVVISGRSETIDRIATTFTKQGIKTQPLTVSHAFHSPLMAPMMSEFERIAREISYAPPQTLFVSAMTGQLVSHEVTDPAYWVRHVREPVRFADGLAAALRKRNLHLFVEIGAKPTLLSIATQVLDAATHGAQQESRPVSAPELATGYPLMTPSLRPGVHDQQQMLESLATLYAQGVNIRWDNVYQHQQRRKVSLPTYPFQRQRYQIKYETARQLPATAAAAAEFTIAVHNEPTTQPLARKGSMASHRRGQEALLIDMPEIRQQKLRIYLSQIIGNALGVASTTLLQEPFAITRGLDSLMVMGIKQQIQHELGVNLPIELLMQDLSLEELALQVSRLLERTHLAAVEDKLADPLVMMQPEGQSPPFFFVHPIAGVVFPYHQLATLLGRTQPIYGLQAIKRNGQPIARIEEMAAIYIAAMRTVQPHGPYYVGGWSFGAFVAFEIARQLRQAGDTIGLLASLDQEAPAASQLANFWNGLQFLVTTGIPSLWPYARDYMPWRNPTPRQTELQQRYHEQAMGELLRTVRANGQSILRYRPARYEGDLTLFQTTTQLKRAGTDREWGWRQLVHGTIERVEVPGHHMNLLNEPYVQVLAEKMRIKLGQAQRRLDVTLSK